MAGRTLTACAAGLELAKAALDVKGLTQESLARKTIPPDRDGLRQGDPVSPKTVQNFLGGRPISVQFFHALCNTLEIDWRVVSGYDVPDTKTAVPSNETTADEAGKSVNQSINQNNGVVFGVIDGDISITVSATRK